MQEEVNQKTVALSIRAAKLSGKVLASAFQKVLGDVKKHHQRALTPQGRQSVKKLIFQDPCTTIRWLISRQKAMC